MVECQQLWSIIDASVVNIEHVLEEVTIVFKINLDSNIVHEAFDCHRQGIGLNKKLCEDEQEDLEEGEGQIYVDDRLGSPFKNLG